MPMLSRTLEKTLRRALALANARQHEYATLEHLLMALTGWMGSDGDGTLAGCMPHCDAADRPALEPRVVRRCRPLLDVASSAVNAVAETRKAGAGS